MDVEVFLKEGGVAEAGADECGPPYIIHFVMDVANLAMARDRAGILLRGVDQAAGRAFRNDSERAMHVISDTVLTNAHTNQTVMQAMAFLLVYLCTDTPEKKTALTGGGLTRVGYVLSPGDGDGDGDDGPSVDFRYVFDAGAVRH